MDKNYSYTYSSCCMKRSCWKKELLQITPLVIPASWIIFPHKTMRNMRVIAAEYSPGQRWRQVRITIEYELLIPLASFLECQTEPQLFKIWFLVIIMEPVFSWGSDAPKSWPHEKKGGGICPCWWDPACSGLQSLNKDLIGWSIVFYQFQLKCFVA